MAESLKKIRSAAPAAADVIERVLGVKTETTIDCRVCGRKNRIKPEMTVHHCGYCKALLV